MKFLVILCLSYSLVNGGQLLNEDQRRDELNYSTNTRSKRALCGAQRVTVTRRPPIFTWPTQDPSCRYCYCNGIGPIVSKRDSLSSKIIGPGLFGRCTNYYKCCSRWNFPVNTLKSASAGKSISDASLSNMASSLISKIGKRASDNQFKKPSIDLVFLIDDSGSIPAAQFKVAKEGAATLSQALCPRRFGSQKGQKQVSAVLFSTTAQTVMTYADSRKGAGYVEEKILNLQQRSGATSTVDAIKHIREKVITGPGNRLNDPDTATVVFVITDGKCNNGCSQLSAEAKKLRKAGPGVQVFAFGVGEADCDELELIRGGEAGEVFGLPDFNFFEKFAIAVKEQMAKNKNACM